MINYLVALVILAGLLIGGFFLFNSYIYDKKQGGAEGHLNATFVINSDPITLVEGVHEEASLPGDEVEWKTTTQYFGNVAKGDLNDDGITDLAFLLLQDGGGTGKFFYAVATLQNSAGRYIGTNGIMLGDRIAPQSTEIRNGILIVNYADRGPDEPMAASPSIGVSAYIYYDGEKLVAVPPIGPISIEGTMVCLPHRDTEGPQTMECASGLLDEFGRYFALADTDPEYKNVAGVPMDTKVRAEGTFKLRSGSDYQDIGVIEVTAITPL